MLVLSRNIGDSIRIGDIIKLRVLENDGSQVRIDIDAPREVSVQREEVCQRIQAEVSGNR